MNMLKTILAGTGVVALAVAYVSCTKDYSDRVATANSNLYNKAQLQVYNTTLNTQRTFVYADGVPLNGAALIYTQTTATNAAHSGSGLTYTLSPGLHAFMIRDTLSTSTQPPLSFSENLDANKFYSLFTYDSMNALKQKTVATTLVVPADTTARIRFANFVYWKTGTPPAMDIFSKRLNANVFTGINYTDVTEFIPYMSGVSDSLIVRPTGQLVNLDTLVTSFTQKRSYTLVFRGRYVTNEIGGALFPRTLASFPNN